MKRLVLALGRQLAIVSVMIHCRSSMARTARTLSKFGLRRGVRSSASSSTTRSLLARVHPCLEASQQPSTECSQKHRLASHECPANACLHRPTRDRGPSLLSGRRRFQTAGAFASTCRAFSSCSSTGPSSTTTSDGRLLLQQQQQQQQQRSRQQQQSSYSIPKKRNFHFWLRGGGGASDEETIAATTDLSQKRGPYIDNWCDGAYPVTVCSVQGWRSYMEDEFVTAHDFAAVFDGHGGKAVSRYLRQNLYANLQAALPMVLGSRPELPQDDITAGADLCESNSSAHADDEALVKEQQQQQQQQQPETSVAAPWNGSSSSSTTTTITTKNSAPPYPTVQDYEAALEIALDKVDREVQRISHWSFQGSTALAVWLHVEEDDEPSETNNSNNNNNESESVADDGSNPNESNTASSSSSSSSSSSNPSENPQQPVRTLITANVGDSRAVLSRTGAGAIELSRDHKPSDPVERARIYQLGGQVLWHGQVDGLGEPVEGTGIYRVNGNLALSRAVGDRSERPVVTADPELSIVTLQEEDEFVVLATDGLWDVMSSDDCVSYIRALLENSVDDDSIDRDTIAGLLVEEALRRGSYDNITVVIVWLNVGSFSDRPKTYWI